MVPDTYNFWLFDLDGTLVDAEWSYTREVFDRVGDRIGYGFSDREAELLWHGLTGARDPLLREWGLDPAEFWPAFHAVEDPAARASATFLHPDAERLLARVDARDPPTGLVTHCAEFLADPVLDRLDLRDRFDTVLSCSDETGWKPDPGPLERAMADIGVDPVTGRGVYVGDGASDVGAAWNADLDAIHVERHGHEERGRCVMADHRVERLDQLPGVGCDPDRDRDRDRAGDVDWDVRIDSSGAAGVEAGDLTD
ncbi:HAD family hydrolase [Halobaculum sp. CBA1158]|uniref:HAD family hydrolase n=1 Tax=Halobaculum sp. CBA1158 TaxID=2904243 RepID=UPI001F2F386B|nr:HAD family hydrolase [Halobaculum sp. CBA1158]UIO99510.1 HAD family hydrolase [Halobaculum sp. CBA1158]